MYHIRKDTLAYHKSRMLFASTDVGAISVPETVKQLNLFFKSQGQAVSPESEALTFYLLNHAFSELAKKYDNHEILGPDKVIVEKYCDLASKSVMRLVYYMLLICTREARHLNSAALLDGHLQSVLGEWATVFINFRNDIPASSNQAADFLRNSPPKMPLKVYLLGIREVFNKGKFGAGYGGKPWGKITDTLLKAVTGETSLEIMMDTAWTLAHNNGPMFNKGMLYQNYSKELLKILDVQRSGQIPQLIKEYPHTTGINAEVSDLYQLCSFHFPEKMGGYVDWYKVEALGSIAKYPVEKAAQVKKYGAAPIKAQPNKGEIFYITPQEYATIKIRKAA